MKLQLLFLLLLLSLTTKAQIEWQKCLGGTNYEYVNSVEQTEDGGYIVAGYSYSNDGDVTGNHLDSNGYTTADVWIVKLDAAGTIQWQKSYGGTKFDYGKHIQQTQDGGFIVAGNSNSNDGDVSGHHGGETIDYWLLKLDSIGTIQWQKSYGGSGMDELYSIKQTYDGGYVVAGNSDSNDGDVSGNHGYFDYWIINLDSLGNLEWEKSLGGNYEDFPFSISQTLDSGYIVAGNTISTNGDITNSFGFGDCWVVKLFTNGNIQWQKSFGGSGEDKASSVKQTNDGGYIFVGSTNSTDGDITFNHGYTDCWVVKLDNLGNISWQYCLGGSGQENGYNIQFTNDGGFIIIGNTDSNDFDVSGNDEGKRNWVVKLDSLGFIQWQKTFGGSHYEYAVSIKQTNDDGYIFAAITESNDGDVTDNHGGSDYWIVKLGAATSIKETDKLEPFVYPNPATTEITVSGYSPAYLKLCDAVGQTVTESKGSKLYVGNLSQGLYVLQLFDAKGQQVKTEKVIVAK